MLSFFMLKAGEPDGFSLDGHITFVYETEVLNISIGGAALTADRKLDVGSGGRLQLVGSGEVMLIDGILAWCVKSGEGTPRASSAGKAAPAFKVGMQFTNVSPEKVSELVNFIERHKKSEESRIGGLRFNIFSPEKATLSYKRRFTVGKLGLAEITVRTREELVPGQRFPVEVFLREGETVAFVGEVSLCGRCEEEAGELFEAGVNIAEISEGDRARLEAYVRSSA
jgi:hypothetical protein